MPIAQQLSHHDNLPLGTPTISAIPPNRKEEETPNRLDRKERESEKKRARERERERERE